MRARTLLLEKDVESAAQIQNCLRAGQHQVVIQDPDELTPELKSSGSFDAVLFAEDSCSLSVTRLREILDLDHRSTFLVLLGAAPSVDRVVDVMLEGAHAYLTKPVAGERLQGVLGKGLETKGTLDDILEMAKQVREQNRQLHGHKQTLLLEKRRLEQKSRRLRFLHELSLAINASLDRQQIVERVFMQLREVLQVRWCRVRLFCQDSEELGWEYVQGTPEQSLEEVSLLLELGGKALGILEVALGDTISREDRQLLDTIALQVALALQNASHHAEVKRLADCDVLTRLNNRRSFQRQLEREFAVHQRYQDNLSLILFDIDHFKSINDLHGHQAGDEVLRQMGRLMQETFRNCDYLARWGGDEFAAILPRTAKEQAFYSAERLRQSIRRTVLDVGDKIRVSASFGVADTRSIPSGSEEELLTVADHALYQAKKAGRNRIRIYQGNTAKSYHPSELAHGAWAEART